MLAALVGAAVVVTGACSTTGAVADDEAGLDSGDPTGAVSEDDAGEGEGEGDTAGESDSGATLDMAREASCDPWIQDCPEGKKCSWRQLGDEQDPVCVLIAPDPKQVGDACEVSGDPGSPYDDCDLGLICAQVEGEGAPGVCMTLCAGNEIEAHCEHVDFPALCRPCAGCPSLCQALCDPLADKCAEGFACVPEANEFTCHPITELGSGGLGDSCEYALQCQAGHLCLDAAAVPGCEGGGCCSPICSLSQPSCPPDTGCVPWFDPLRQADYPDLGVCRI